MKTLLGGALVASILALGGPAMAANLSQDPIAIESVASNPTDYNSYAPGSIGITFRNNAENAATQVTFLVTDAQGDQTTITDDGMFATGVTVRHDFELPQLRDDASVKVVQVELSDGSSWTAAPQGTPSASRELSNLESALDQPAAY